MLATLLYLLTVASCLLVPVYFPGFEGADQRVVIPLAIASATQAALHQEHAVRPRWRNMLASCWATGCTLTCTPHLFLTEPATQMVVQGGAMALAGIGLTIAAARGVLFERALSVGARTLYGGALVATGIVLVAVGTPVVPRPYGAAEVFEPIIFGVAGFTVASVIVARRGAERRPTTG